jgi:parvulin-like peptidyl-prolyl isomerase
VDTSSIVMLRIEHRSLTLRQLLQRLRIDAMLADIDRCKNDLTVECWADAIGVTADTAELQAAVNRFRREHGLFTAAQANEWLGRRGMTLDDLVAILKPQALRASLSRHVAAEEDIRRHYLEFAYQYDRAEISIIVTDHYGAAQELFFRVEEGADFHALAREYSSDAATARSGGYAGLVGRAELEPETAAAVWGAAEGSVVGPFERRGAYRLILIEGLYPAELNESVEAAIREQLFQDRLVAYRQTVDIQEEIWSLDER